MAVLQSVPEPRYPLCFTRRLSVTFIPSYDTVPCFLFMCGFTNKTMPSLTVEIVYLCIKKIWRGQNQVGGQGGWMRKRGRGRWMKGGLRVYLAIK